MINYSITKVQAYTTPTHANVVKEVTLEINAISGAYKARSFFPVTFGDYEDFSSPPGNFIPYENLTQAQLIEWSKDKIGADVIAAIEHGLNTQLIEMSTTPRLVSIAPPPDNN